MTLNQEAILGTRACLSIVVPAYNEERTLARIIEKLMAVPNLLEIVIVDDCSTDGTGEVAKRLAAEHDLIKYVRHDKNQGKTAALRTGFTQTTGEIVIVQDADLEYDPAEIPEVIRPSLTALRTSFTVRALWSSVPHAFFISITTLRTKD
jgi:glycosyltransferase involved in cell wall biosynthesis